VRTDLRPTGGSITDTTKPGVRRVLNLELAPTPGLFDLLAPVGTLLTVFAHITYMDRRPTTSRWACSTSMRTRCPRAVAVGCR
jgi:hypothetical protein